MSRFTDLLADPYAERRILAILEPYDGVAAAVTTIYLSSHGFTSTPSDTPSNVHFEGRLQVPSGFRRALFSQGRLSGRSVPAAGALVIANADGGLDRLGRYGWGGRRVRLLMGGADFALADYGTIFDGTAAGLGYGETDITLNLSDLSLLLDREIQTATFAGTGNNEGAAELAGKRKPLAYGILRGVPPVYLGPDSAGKHRFALADGPICTVGAVYDRGVALTYAASPAAGQYSADLEAGTITLGGAFNGPLTCQFVGRRYADVLSTSTIALPPTQDITMAVPAGHGLVPGSYVWIARVGDPVASWMQGRVQSVTATSVAIRLASFSGASGSYSDWRISPWGTVAGVMRQIAARAGVTIFDTAALAALDAAQPCPVGYWLQEGGNGLQILDALADGTGAWWGFGRTGAFQGGRLDAPSGTPSAAYDPTTILALRREALEEPNYRIDLRHSRNWQPLTTDQLAGIADANRTKFTRDFLTASFTIDPGRSTFPGSKLLQVDTLFDFQAPADLNTELGRLVGIYGTLRDYFRATIRARDMAADIGSVVRVTYPRHGLSAGKLLRVVDLSEDLDAGTIELGLWG